MSVVTTASAILFVVMIRINLKRAISLLLIITLCFCVFPSFTLATGETVTLTACYDEEENFSLTGNDLVTGELGELVLYVETINEGDEVLLKNDFTEYSDYIGPEFYTTIDGEEFSALETIYIGHTGTFPLDESIQVTYDQLIELGVSEDVLLPKASTSYYFVYDCSEVYALLIQVKGAALEDQSLTLSLYFNNTSELGYVKGCDSAADIDGVEIEIENTAIPIKKLYIKTIDKGDNLLLKNMLGNDSRIDSSSFRLLDSNYVDLQKNAAYNETVNFPFNINTRATFRQLIGLGIPADLLDKADSTAYYFIVESFGDYGILVQVKGAATPEQLVYSALNEQLDRICVPGNYKELRSDAFYTTDDRFNGKYYTTGGAWAELTKQYGPYDSVVNPIKAFELQEEISAAAIELQAAIDRLIPTTCANPTLLYEELRNKWKYEGIYVQKWLGTETATFVTEENTTATTWQTYATAINESRSLINSLYENGNPVATNTAILQLQIDDLTEELRSCAQNFVKQKSYEYAYKYYRDNKEKAFDVLEKYNPSKYTATDYTSASWTTFINAYGKLANDMEYHVRGNGSKAEYDKLSAFCSEDFADQAGVGHIDAVKIAANALESAVDITLSSLTFIDNGGVRYPQAAQRHQDKGKPSPSPDSYVRVFSYDDLEINAGHSKAKTIIEEKIVPYLDDRMFRPYIGVQDFWGTYMIFVNGEFAEMSRGPVTCFHNGDDVKIVYLCTPTTLVEVSTSETTSATSPEPATNEKDFADSISNIKISVPAGEIKVGEEVEFSATLTGAYPLSKNFGKQLSPENISLFISKPSGEWLSTADANPTIDTGKKTDSTGKLSYTFTEPGDYIVALYDVEPDDPTFTDIFGITTLGRYNSVKAGDFATVTVTASDDETALLQSWSTKYLAEAKTYFDEFHEYDFAEGFYESKLTPAYETLKEHIASASTFKGLTDSYKADFDALKALGGQALNHGSVIDDFRKRLSCIPEDEAKLDSGYADLISGIKADFEAMNEHTKALLSPAEIDRIAQITGINVSALKPQPNVCVDITKGGNSLGDGGIFWKSPTGTGGATYHGWPNIKYVLSPNADGTLPNADFRNIPQWSYDTPLSAKSRDHVFLQFYAPIRDNGTLRSEDNYWLMWSLDGQNWDEVPLQAIYNGDVSYDYFILEYVIPDDVADGSTITIDLKTVSRAEHESYIPAGIREAAIAAVNAAYDEYSKATNADAAKLAQIKADALAKIEAATTEADVTNARKAAVAAMAAAFTATGSESGITEPESSFDAGKQVGTVSLIIENTTYSGAPFTGTIAKGTYPLCENDSMMTVVLKALEAKGFNWNGTRGDLGSAGGSTGNHDYTISYLSSINKGAGSENRELGEFDGGRKSGWMGTLNDWFVNESFSAFTVESGSLESGDEIHIMYTCDLGADIGGSWVAGDTAIKNINFSTGKLAPAFDSDTYDYMLIIPSASAKLKVDYAIRNMNFQSRIFLNYYNKESARYKKSDVLSVKSGDTLYIGVGDPSWPSMNSSGKGAKYVFSVYTLEDAINRLPAASVVKMNNYKQYLSQAEQLESMISAFNYSGNTEKLTALKDAATFYNDIDRVKTLLAAIPKAEKLSRNDRSKVEAAKAGYDKLNDEQKKYITVADASKYNAAVEWLETQGISTGGRIKGNDEVPEELPVEQPAAEKVVETVKVEATADSKGVAKAEVASKDVSAAVKSATETKADAIVIAPEIKGEAKEVKVNLPKAAVNEIAEKTTASLVIETKTASVEVPTAVLNEIAAQAGGTSVEISVALKTADTAEVKEAIAVMGDKIGSDVVTENAAVAEITVVSGNEKITTFGGKSINASVSVDGKKGFTEGKKYLTLVISENGKKELLAGKCTLDASGKLSVGVEVGHLSTFVVLDKELKSFADADAHWSAKAVDFAVANGLMNGISDTAFDPNATLNRAMLVTVLYRLAGSQAVTTEKAFDDVAAGQWYSDAVAWAAENGIVTGKTDTSFAPMDNITREQFATMLMRYCSFAGLDAAKRAELGKFTDNDAVSSYANEALSWANANGIITGRTETTIAPKGNATRGEAATMLMRFMQL